MPHLEVSDCVFSLQAGEWKAIVSGRIHGPFNSRGAAEAGMQTEQRREAARIAREAFNVQATAYLSLPTNAPIETVLGTLADEADDDEAYNAQRDRDHGRATSEAAQREEMTGYHANALNKAMGVIASHRATAQAPVVPAATAPLYMAALNSFWLTVHSVYPKADKVTMPQAIAQAFEQAAAGVVEAWINAYNAGGYSDGNFGG